jgi:hypothetical protein
MWPIRKSMVKLSKRLGIFTLSPRLCDNPGGNVTVNETNTVLECTGSSFANVTSGGVS